MRTGNSNGSTTAVGASASPINSPLSEQVPFAISSTGVNSGTPVDLHDLLATLGGFEAPNAFKTCSSNCNGSQIEVGCGVGTNLSRTIANGATQLQTQIPPVGSTADVLTMPASEYCVDDDSSAVAGLSLSPTRRSANMTERVSVPSSEHVAEIVGRQGCKIKALRNKTNTYIKTPVRGEEPVFVVTGRREDVDAARREIISAAEHFSHIRATRTSGLSRSSASSGSQASNVTSPEGDSSKSSTSSEGVNTRRLTPSPRVVENSSKTQGHHAAVSAGAGQVSIGVRVPISMVGLVVGPKGATVKRIQQDTGTYIVTPGRQKDPVFEVIGSPVGVERARRQIEAYLETRIGPSSSLSSVTASSAQLADISSSITDWYGNINHKHSTSVDRCQTASSHIDNARSASYQHAYVDLLKKRIKQSQHQQLQQFIDNRRTSSYRQLQANISEDVHEDNFSSLFSSTQSALPADCMTSFDDQLETEGLLSLFYSKMHQNGCVSATTLPGGVASNLHYHHQQHLAQNSQNHRQQPASGNPWLSLSNVVDCMHSSMSTVRPLAAEFDDDNVDCDVTSQLTSDPISSWNYIFSVAGLLPQDIDNRHQHQIGDNFAGERGQLWSPSLSNIDRLMSPAIALNDSSSTSRHMFAGNGPSSDTTTAQGVLMGGAPERRYCNYYVSGGGSNDLNEGLHRIGGSQETSPSSTSPVESFSAGSSSG